MFSNKLFNSFVSNTFWRFKNFSKVRADFTGPAKFPALPLSRRFFLSIDEGGDGVISEEVGQLRLHLRSIFGYNRSTFHAAKGEGASEALGFLRLADLFFLKQQRYWAGEGNWNYYTGKTSPLFFQAFSNFSTVISFERVLFSSETRSNWGRFLPRFNQTAPFYLNGLGRRSTSAMNYRVKLRSHFLREPESTTKSPATLFDSFAQPAFASISLKNGSPPPHLYLSCQELGRVMGRSIAPRLAYLNEFSGGSHLSIKYSQLYLTNTHLAHAVHSVNAVVPSMVWGGWGSSLVRNRLTHAACYVPGTAYLKLKTLFLTSCVLNCPNQVQNYAAPVVWRKKWGMLVPMRELFHERIRKSALARFRSQIGDYGLMLRFEDWGVTDLFKSLLEAAPAVYIHTWLYLARGTSNEWFRDQRLSPELERRRYRGLLGFLEDVKAQKNPYRCLRRLQNFCAWFSMRWKRVYLNPKSSDVYYSPTIQFKRNPFKQRFPLKSREAVTAAKTFAARSLVDLSATSLGHQPAILKSLASLEAIEASLYESALHAMADSDTEASPKYQEKLTKIQRRKLEAGATKTATKTANRELDRVAMSYFAFFESKLGVKHANFFKHPAFSSVQSAIACHTAPEYRILLKRYARRKARKRYSVFGLSSVRRKPSTFAVGREFRTFEGFVLQGVLTAKALGFHQTVALAAASVAFPKLAHPFAFSSGATALKSDYGVWFNQAILNHNQAFSDCSTGALFGVFNLTGALNGKPFGAAKQLLVKFFYARRYLKLVSAYNELILVQTQVGDPKRWFYRLSKLNERASFKNAPSAMMLSTPGKYAELLTLMPNALAGLPHPAGGSLMENLEIGPLGFAQGGASKHHAEFFLLFSGAQVSGGSVLTNYRTLNPINRSMVSQARRQFAQLNFDLEFFDRLAGVMWDTNVTVPTKGRANISDPLVPSRFNITSSVSSFVPEYDRSWFFNSLDSVQNLEPTGVPLAPNLIGTSDFNRELTASLHRSLGCFEFNAALFTKRSGRKIWLLPTSCYRISTNITAFWYRVNSSLFYDL